METVFSYAIQGREGLLTAYECNEYCQNTNKWLSNS